MSAQRNGKWYAVTAVGVPLDKAALTGMAALLMVYELKRQILIEGPDDSSDESLVPDEAAAILPVFNMGKDLAHRRRDARGKLQAARGI